ncbi:hypothetical protein GW17_00028353 [Ensete ventricosum]|nr:hypothetical protein GW17_00028353 [Ensete ventricosum]
MRNPLSSKQYLPTLLQEMRTNGLVRHVGRHNVLGFPDNFARDRPRAVQPYTAHLDPLFRPARKESEANFLASGHLKPTVASILGMRQKEDEPLGPYLARFMKEIRVIPNVHLSLIIQAFMIGIRPSRLFWLLVERSSVTVLEMP